jgi:hypothetical protein
MSAFKSETLSGGIRVLMTPGPLHRLVAYIRSGGVDIEQEEAPGNLVADPAKKDGREEMILATPAVTGRFSGIDARRSTRLERAIPLIIMGKDKLGELSEETTSAVSLNLHGCGFSSRHDYPVETWINLQVTEPNGEAKSPPVRAKVRSVRVPETPLEPYQVGVELEAPGNVWGIPAPPEDWRDALEGDASRIEAVAGVAPAREPVVIGATLPRTHTAAEQNMAEVAAFAAPPAAAEPAKDPGLAKAERMVVTKDQLFKALQGQLQLAAEKAVQDALATQLDEAAKKALYKIAEVYKVGLRQAQEFTGQRLENLVSSSQEEVLSRLTVQLGEVRSRLAEEQNEYRSRTEEIAQRLEELVRETQQSFSDAQAYIGKVAHELVPQFQSLHTRLDEYAGRAAEDFEVLVTSASARHLVQLKESTLKVTQEASAQLEARSAEVVSRLNGEAGPLFEERIETLLRSSREQILSRLEERLGELWRDWEQQDIYRSRTEAIAERLEKLASNTQTDLANTRDFVEKAAGELETQMRVRLDETVEERLKNLVNAAREEILSRLEERLSEARSHWEEAYHRGAEELAQRLQKLAAEPEPDETQGFIEKAASELEPLIRTRMEETVGRAREEFEAAAALVSDRQLVRLMEATRMETREASSQLEARAAEARAMIQTAAHGILDEFRRQAEVQIDLAISEATQRTKSSLASLEAENRAACEARRRTPED